MTNVGYDHDDEKARETIKGLLGALHDEDASTYYRTLAQEDKNLLSEEDVSQGMITMREACGALRSFTIVGADVHQAADYAAVHVTLDFEKRGLATEVYHLVREDGEWKFTLGRTDHP